MLWSSRSRAISEGSRGSYRLGFVLVALLGFVLLALLGFVLLALLGAGCGSLRGTRSDGSRAEGNFNTTVYLTRKEALRAAFPGAREVIRDRVTLSAAERAACERHLGSRLAREDFTVYLGLAADGTLDGYAVIQEEIGKFKLITFIVAVEPSGEVRRVAVMVYREARGGEVAHQRFLVQYSGKTVADAFSINRDIINITGATMSVNSMNRGVKKVLALLETVYRRHPERLQRALEQGEKEPEFAAVEAEPGGVSPMLHREARLVMGSLCEIQAWGDDRESLRAACRRAFSEVERIDSLLSDYRPQSELSRLSAMGAREALPISPGTADFLARAAAISRSSDGAFDVTVGPLVDAWGFRTRSPRRPEDAELAALRPLVDYRLVEVYRGADRRWYAKLARDDMRLDPGGLGKGFAVDRAVASLEESGVEAALVNFSGCIYALGAPPGRSAWRVAVRHPARPSEILGVLSLRDEAVAASGGHEKSIEVNGARWSHILSPRTLRPVPGILGAVVRAPDATLADGWSTAATVLGEDAVRCLERTHGLEATVFLADGRQATRHWTLEEIELEPFGALKKR